MRSEFFYLAAAAFFLTDSLHAQSEETVSMMIDVVAWGDDIGGLSFKSGEKKGGDIIVSVLPSASSHKRHKSSAYDVYDYDQRIIYL